MDGAQRWQDQRQNALAPRGWCSLTSLFRILFAGALFAALVSARADPPRALYAARTNKIPVWLVSNGFHSSIAVPLRASALPLRKMTGDARAEFLVIGWGDANFYRATRVTPSMASKATFCPNPSALHVFPARGSIATRFAHSDVVRFEVSPAGFARLCAFIDHAFQRTPDGRPLLLGPGHLPGTRFYAGRERFYFPKVCNIWTAKALRSAGVPIFLPTAITAGDLVWQGEKAGRREQWKRLPLDGF